MASEWDDRHSGIAMLSFTNVAWRQIAERLDSVFDARRLAYWPHFLGTIDSFVNRFLFMPFGHIPMGLNRRPDLVTDHNQAWVNKVCAVSGIDSCYRNGCSPCGLRYTVEGTLSRASDRERCDGGKSECTKMKSRLAKSGFATSSDAMYWALKALSLPGISAAVARRFPQIIVDEAQDTSDVQLAILSRLRSDGSRIVLIGDPNQAIYEFNEARPDLFCDLADKWGSLRLTGNFRSSQPICDAAQALAVRPAPMQSVGEASSSHLRPQLWRYAAGQEPTLLSRFKDEITSQGIPENAAAALVRASSALDKLLTRPKWPKGVGSVAALLLRAALDYDHGRPADAHQRVMHALVYLCFKANSLGVAFANIAPIAIREWRAESWQLLCRLPDTRLPLQQWMKAAKSEVDDFFLRTGWPREIELGQQFRCPKEAGATCPIELEPSAPEQIGLQCMTIHSAKGREFDAVMAICTPGGGGRRSDLVRWLQPRDKEREEQRVGYVAVTRAKRLLVVAIPENTPADLVELLRPRFDAP